MIRKIIATILLFTFSISVNAFAAVSVTLDSDTHTMCVSDNNTKYANKRITIEILKPDVNEDKLINMKDEELLDCLENFEEVIADENGIYSFATVLGDESGFYSVIVKPEGDDKIVIYDAVMYISDKFSQKFTQDYKVSQDKASVIVKNSKIGNINIEDFMDFSKNDKEIIIELIGDKFDSFSEFKNLYILAMTIYYLNNDNENKAFEYIKELCENEKYMLCDKYFSDSEKVVVLKELCNKNIVSIDKCLELIFEKAVLKSVENIEINSELELVLTDFAEIIEYDLLPYFKCKDKSTINSEIAGIKFDSVSDIVSKINNIISRMNKNEKSPSDKVTGGGGFCGKADIPVVNNNSQLGENPVFEFSDVPKSYWGYNAIMKLFDKKIINGKSSKVFAPEDNVTRAEFAKMLSLIIGDVAMNKKLSFKDVSKGDWYEGYISKVYNAGIVKGINDSQFCPNDFITRQDMAVMAYNTIKYMNKMSNENINKVSFEDYTKISDYAKEAVDNLSALKIINGMEDGNFYPMSLAGRAQAAKVLCGVLDYIEK